MEMQHDTLWNEAVAFTRAKSPASFEQWFSGVQFDGMTDGVVCLRARDEFVREWVDQHFLPTLVDYLRSQTGCGVQFAWSVGGELPRPVADGAATGMRPRLSLDDTHTHARTAGPASTRSPMRPTDDVEPMPVDTDGPPASRRSTMTRAVP